MVRPAGWLVRLTLAGCPAYEPFEPPMPGELKPGPGLLSGPSSEFVLYRQAGDQSAAAAAAKTASPPPRRRLTDPPPP